MNKAQTCAAESLQSVLYTNMLAIAGHLSSTALSPVLTDLMQAPILGGAIGEKTHETKYESSQSIFIVTGEEL